VPENETAEQQTPEGGAAATEEQAAPAQPVEGKVYTEDYVKALRAEAAGYRTKLREAEEKFAAAKSQEDVDAAVAALKADNETLRRDLVAAQFNLPPELAKRLSGSTEDELKADAEALAQFVAPQGREDEDERTPRGGLTPGSKGGIDADALLATINRRRRIY
jgi:hypothetical protein